MPQAWSALNARVHNRLARHWATAPFRLRNNGPMVSFTFDDVPKSAATAGAKFWMSIARGRPSMSPADW